MFHFGLSISQNEHGKKQNEMIDFLRKKCDVIYIMATNMQSLRDINVHTRMIFVKHKYTFRCKILVAGF